MRLGSVQNEIYRFAFKMFFMSIFLCFGAFVIPAYGLQIYDRVLVSKSFDTLFLITIIAFALNGLITVIDNLRAKIIANFCLEWASRCAIQFADFRSDYNNNSIYRDFQKIVQFGWNPGVIAFFDLVWLPIIVFGCSLINPNLGLTAFLILFCFLLLQISFRNLRSGESEQVSPNHFEPLRQVLEETRHELSLSGKSEKLFLKSIQLFSESVSNSNQVHFKNQNFGSTSRYVRESVQIIALMSGAYLFLNDEISIGTIYIFTLIMPRACGPIEVLFIHKEFVRDGIRTIQNWIVSASKSSQLSNKPPREQLPLLKCSNLQIGRPNSLLSELSFTVKPGEVMCVLGPSNSGKSGLMRTMAGLYRPTKGSVSIGHIDISNGTSKLPFGMLGFYLGSVNLFPGTIGENIYLFDEHATSPLVESLLDLHREFADLPDGLSTVVIWNDSRLSVFQRQLANLARAFILNPDILLIDNLDGLTNHSAVESGIIELVRRRSEAKKSTVIVTSSRRIHDISDQTLLLINGQLKFLGPTREFFSTTQLDRMPKVSKSV